MLLVGSLNKCEFKYVKLLIHSVEYPGGKEREHDFVVTGDGQAATLTRRGSVYYILQRTVMLGHVKIGRGKMVNLEAHILCYRQGFQENFQHNYCAAYIYEDPSVP